MNWKTTLRKFRYVPIQFVLAGAVLIFFITYRSEPKERLEAKWAEFRNEELKKYDDRREVDLKFLRQTGRVDHRIEDLTEKDLDKMNLKQLMVAVHSFLDNADAICGRRIRMGSLSEGGWEICDDDIIRPPNPPCLVYSFGDVDHFAFEDDVARVYKCEVHSFRKEIEGGDYNRTRQIQVHPFTISKYTEISPEGKELYTFGDIRTILGHKKRNVDVVKLDIDNAEWSALEGMIDSEELDNVRQVLVEYHVGAAPTEDKLRRMLRVLQGMSETGFRKFYVSKSERGLYHHPNFPVARSKAYDIHYINMNYMKKKQEASRKPTLVPPPAPPAEPKVKKEEKVEKVVKPVKVEKVVKMKEPEDDDKE